MWTPQRPQSYKVQVFGASSAIQLTFQYYPDVLGSGRPVAEAEKVMSGGEIEFVQRELGTAQKFD